MTATAMTEPGIGEHRLRERRRRFWRMVGGGVLLGGVIGIAVGFVGGFAKGWQDAGGSAIGWLLWPLFAIALYFFWRFCVMYFRRIDELDLQDNLWASLIGLYAVIMVLPAWHALHLVGQLPVPDAYGLWIVAFVVTSLAYGWRKLGHRFF